MFSAFYTNLEKSREHDNSELHNYWTKWRYTGQRSRSNELPAIPDTWKGQVANRGPDDSPRHFCLKLQSGPGSNSDAGAGGRSGHGRTTRCPRVQRMGGDFGRVRERHPFAVHGDIALRSEEHTSELQSRSDLVCRLLLEKKQRL